MIDINGMAHVILTVSQFEKSRDFYCELLPFLGMTKVYDGNNFVYHVGGRTAIGIQRCADGMEDERFAMNRVGKLGQGALSTISVAGNMFDRHILEHYRASVKHKLRSK